MKYVLETDTFGMCSDQEREKTEIKRKTILEKGRKEREERKREKKRSQLKCVLNISHSFTCVRFVCARRIVRNSSLASFSFFNSLSLSFLLSIFSESELFEQHFRFFVCFFLYDLLLLTFV